MLLDVRLFRLHHLLDLCLHFIWQLAEIAWFDPTVFLTSLQKRAEVKLIACLLATLILASLFVPRTDFLLLFFRQVCKALPRFAATFTPTLALALALAFLAQYHRDLTQHASEVALAPGFAFAFLGASCFLAAPALAQIAPFARHPASRCDGMKLK